jgi:ketosteroid isomerase-like protein
MEQDPVRIVRRYFDGCGTGDAEEIRATLAPDVVHYFLPSRSAPIAGARALADHWIRFRQASDTRWALDRIVAAGDDVVCEWSVVWTPRGTRDRRMMRGCDWYRVHGGLIAEIRAYFVYDPAHDTELTGFPYAARGYMSKAAADI